MKHQYLIYSVTENCEEVKLGKIKTLNIQQAKNGTNLNVKKHTSDMINIYQYYKVWNLHSILVQNKIRKK